MRDLTPIEQEALTRIQRGEHGGPDEIQASLERDYPDADVMAAMAYAYTRHVMNHQEAQEAEFTDPSKEA